MGNLQLRVFGGSANSQENCGIPAFDPLFNFATLNVEPRTACPLKSPQNRNPPPFPACSRANMLALPLLRLIGCGPQLSPEGWSPSEPGPPFRVTTFPSRPHV